MISSAPEFPDLCLEITTLRGVCDYCVVFFSALASAWFGEWRGGVLAGESMRWATFCRPCSLDTARPAPPRPPPPSRTDYGAGSSATGSCTPAASNSTTASQRAPTTSRRTRPSCCTGAGRTARNPRRPRPSRPLPWLPRCRHGLETRCPAAAAAVAPARLQLPATLPRYDCTAYQ